jgi:hypothetical protein
MKNKYPKGRLNKDDQGVLGITIGMRGDTIIMDFGKLVKWIGMDKEAARALANTLLKHAGDKHDA